MKCQRCGGAKWQARQTIQIPPPLGVVQTVSCHTCGLVVHAHDALRWEVDELAGVTLVWGDGSTPGTVGDAIRNSGGVLRMFQEVFAIWSIEHQAWWARGECGYVEQLHEAGVYEAERAREIVERANVRKFHECIIPLACLVSRAV